MIDPWDDVDGDFVPDTRQLVVELSGQAGLDDEFQLTLAIPNGPVVATGSISSWMLGLQQDECYDTGPGVDTWVSRGLISCPITITFEPTGLVKGLEYHTDKLLAKPRYEKVG